MNNKISEHIDMITRLFLRGIEFGLVMLGLTLCGQTKLTNCFFILWFLVCFMIYGGLNFLYVFMVKRDINKLLRDLDDTLLSQLGEEPEDEKLK